MKKIIPLFLLIFVFSSCDFVNTKYQQFVKGEAPQGIDTIIVEGSIDTLALTLDALRKKRIPNGYQIVDDIKTEILFYTGFSMGDVGLYHFKNAAGDEYVFNGNDTNFILEVKSKNPTKENGGLDPNPRYLNKEFRVVWRKIQLIGNPRNEAEFYNQELDQIIYLQEQVRFPSRNL